MVIRAQMSRLLNAIVVALVLAAAPAGAAERDDTLARGPAVGRTIPHSLASRDQDSQYQDFKSLARRRGLILMFSRSLDW